MITHFVSKEQLLSERSNGAKFYSNLNESYDVRSRQPFSNEITVFLSHKHDDGEILKNVISMLKNLGINVYVDWMDEDMPKQTSGTTAVKIKQKIRSCRKFILLATEGAIASKWCNWELGYGDAYKYRNNIAIMPITDVRGGIFSGSEYLQIYPIIKTKFEFTSGEYYVINGYSEIPLKEWLNR